MKSETQREIAERIAAGLGHEDNEGILADAIEAALNAERERAFDKGYVCAVANIMRLHDVPLIARDVLNQNRPQDWSVIDEADRAVLEPIRGRD